MALPLAMQVKLDAARKEEETALAAAQGTDTAAGSQESAGAEQEGSFLTSGEGGSGHEVESTEERTDSTTAPVAKDDGYAKIEARLESLQNLLTALQTENAQLRARLDKAPESPAPIPEISQDELTPEERKAFSQSLPTIEKVARKLANEMTAPMRKQLSELQEKVQSAETSYANMSEEMFVAALEQSVPELRKKLASPNWKAYVNSKIPRTTITVGQALMTAHKGRDPKTIREIFDGFSLGTKQLSNQQVPGTVKSSDPPKAKETLKFSDREKISQDFRKGRIDRKKFDELVAVYEKAAQEGRVNFDT
jgi:predicted  nucleic acid-binding Zn-ribbon protein